MCFPVNFENILWTPVFHRTYQNEKILKEKMSWHNVIWYYAFFLYKKIFYNKMSPKNLKTFKNVTSEA